ncbi:hypothetical protein EJB05_05152, partial [Eragrostis curvula]
VRHRPNRVVGRNHLSQVVARAAVGAIDSSGCTGQIIPRSYVKKIGTFEETTHQDGTRIGEIEGDNMRSCRFNNAKGGRAVPNSITCCRFNNVL